MTCGWCSAELSGRQTKWCSENCRKRACDASHRSQCADCGGDMGTRSGFARPHPNVFCRDCWTRREARAHRARIEDVAEMYREGFTYREMAAELGYGPKSVCPEVHEARRLGLIGYRNNGWAERSAA